MSGASRRQVVHVGNDLVTDVRGAARSCLDTVLVNRAEHEKPTEATATMPDLRPLPDFLGGRYV